ncbi:nuclear transcription factor Y subunit alpha-like [Mugil cephalus]|uniref:nuclear transcription factor Y subunit alpha-like n=1 Tax=Mugil cephalus TaxID=48193 RepID=UPI001FB842BB|nr:nuclear transcription factor Y subunit alpha-like [Mugil cephalus]
MSCIFLQLSRRRFKSLSAKSLFDQVTRYGANHNHGHDHSNFRTNDNDNDNDSDDICDNNSSNYSNGYEGSYDNNQNNYNNRKDNHWTYQQQQQPNISLQIHSVFYASVLCSCLRT